MTVDNSKKTGNQFIKGMLMCIENAEIWEKEASQIADLESYGHATAMIIHAIEAISQAYLCYITARNWMKPTGSDFKKVFTQHGIKIEILLNYSIISQLYETKLPEISKNRGPYEFWEELGNQNLFLEEIDAESAMKRDAFINDIMAKRNSGIYVDYNFNKNEFTSPESVNKQVYSEVLDQYQEFYDLCLTIIRNSENMLDLGVLESPKTEDKP